MSEPARQLRTVLPLQPVEVVDRDRAGIAGLGLHVDSWQVHADQDDEWHTVVYTVSRRRRKRDS